MPQVIQADVKHNEANENSESPRKSRVNECQLNVKSKIYRTSMDLHSKNQEQFLLLTRS